MKLVQSLFSFARFGNPRSPENGGGNPKPETRNPKRRWLALAAALLLGGGTLSAAEIDALLPAVRAYHFGADRAPLAQIEQLVQQSLGHPEQKAALAARLATVLNGDAAYDAKQFVCRQLARIGGDAEIPALAALLTSGDEPLTHMAVYALGRNPSPRATAALLRALPETRGRARLNLVTELGRRRAGEAVPALDQLADDPDPATRAGALAALGRIGTPEARRVLTRRLAAAPPPAPTPLARAALAAAAAIPDGKVRGDDQKLLQLLNAPRQSDLTRAAILGMRVRRGWGTWDEAITALADPAKAVRHQAGQLLRLLPPPVLARIAPETVARWPVDSRRALLGALSGPAHAPLALARVNDPDPSVQAAALAALGRLGDATVVPTLVQAAATRRGAVRDAARHSLARLVADGVNRSLVNLLGTSRDAAAQREILRALTARDATDSAPQLCRLVLTTPPPVRVAALRSLRDLATPDDLPALLDLLAQVDDAQAGEAETAVAAVVRRAPDAASATRTVLDRLAAARSLAHRQRLLRTLGGVGGSAVLTALREALRDDASEIRLTALRVLSEWPDAQPLADLRRVAREGATPRERALALGGWVRMIGTDPRLTPAQQFAQLKAAFAVAPDAGARRRVIGALGKVASPEAFAFARELMARPELRAEAQSATVQLARMFAGALPAKARPVLAAIAQAPASAEIERQARAVLRAIAGFDGFITAWEVSPAYVQAGANCARLFDVPFPPEPDGPGGAVVWRVLPPAAQPNKPWLMDILAVHPGTARVAYARTRVWSPAARQLTLELGTDDGVKLWVNGALVLAHNVTRGCAPGQEKPQVRLRRGWNELLLKITQNIMGWEFCARFVAPDGAPPRDLRCALPGQE